MQHILFIYFGAVALHSEGYRVIKWNYCVELQLRVLLHTVIICIVLLS